MNDRRYACTLCGVLYEVTAGRIVCDCGGPLRLVADFAVLPENLYGRPFGLTRYMEAIALDESALM